MSMNVEASVREFLRERAVVPQEDAIPGDASLLDSGLLDSAGLFELVSYLEERCGVTIADEELLPENFETIDAIVAFMHPKTGDASGGDTAA